MTKKWILANIVLLYLTVMVFFAVPAVLSKNVSAQAPVQAYKPTIAFTPTPVPTPVLVEGEPVHLSIPRLNINLDIINGVYDPTTQTWTLTDNKAEYATITTEPNNESGNTLIYGHNIDQVFYPTAGLEPGDLLLFKQQMVMFLNIPLQTQQLSHQQTHQFFPTRVQRE